MLLTISTSIKHYLPFAYDQVVTVLTESYIRSLHELHELSDEEQVVYGSRQSPTKRCWKVGKSFLIPARTGKIWCRTCPMGIIRR